MDFLGDFLSKVKPTYDDSAVDRLHYVWTCLIITLLSLTIGMYQFGGTPIVCWTPAQFTGFWNQYVTDYCFVENTYFLPWAAGVPEEVKQRQDREIVYYQWVPFILAFQALLFYIPHVLWNVLNSQSGINVERIIKMVRETKNINFKDRKANVVVASSHITESLTLQKDFGGRKDNPFMLFVRCGKREGIYVTCVYLVIKCLYLANIVGQFFMLNTFLGPQYNLWGIGILNDILNGREWHSSGHFPRTTMCDFQVRVLGNLHRWTVQCVLWINMLNEKIFIFLWFWMLIVAVITFFDLCYWFVVSLAPGLNDSFVSKFLRVKKLVKRNANENEVRAFVKSLRPDGVFIFRLLAQNAGELLTADIIKAMWEKRAGNREPRAIALGSEEFQEVDPNATLPLMDTSGSSSEKTKPPAYSPVLGLEKRD